MDYLAAVGDGRLGRSQNPMSQNSTRALVVGMGATGLSIARHFLRQGFQVAAADSRMSPPCKKEFAALPGAECRCGEDFRNWRAEDFRDFARIGKSPGAPMEWLAAATDSDSNSDSQKIVGDAGLFAESLEENPLPIKILAATGANGKSTVVALLAAMCRKAGLRAAAVGNIGLPLLDALAAWREAAADAIPEVAAVELSSFQLEGTARFPSLAAAVLNVSPDHLDRHGTLENYIAAKARIYRGAKTRVINLDSPTNDSHHFSNEGEAITFSETRKADWMMDGDAIVGDGKHFPLSGLSARTPPPNALAALAIVSPLGLPFASSAKALANFDGLPHRRREAAVVGGAVYIDDSKATNVAAACFALQQTARRLQTENGGNIILIAGGEGKGQDFSSLAHAAIDCGRFKAAILIGRAAPELQSAMQSVGAENTTAADLESAVELAAAMSSHGDAILLSPACSSLDSYKNFAERGEAFVAACRRLSVKEKEAADAPQ